MPSIIIIDQMHPSIIPQLESLGYRVSYQPDIVRDQLVEQIGKYQGLVVRSKTTVDNDLLERAGNLRFVARAGAGVDNLDEKAITRRGIRIINAPEGNRDALAEHMVGMLLGLMHKIYRSDQAIRSGIWDREAFRGKELQAKTLGVVGCGNMGTAFAKRLQSFGCRILGYDKYLKSSLPAVFEPADLEKLFQECDIVSLHVPLTDETRGFYNYSFFEKFEKPIILLNSARGEIMPLSDLVRLMKEGRITEAALDVFEVEPFVQNSDNQIDIYDYILKNPSVLLSSHVAGWSFESYQRINRVLVDKIRALKLTRPSD